MHLLWKAIVYKCLYFIPNLDMTVFFSDVCDAGLVSPRFCAARANLIIFYNRNPSFKMPQNQFLIMIRVSLASALCPQQFHLRFSTNKWYQYSCRLNAEAMYAPCLHCLLTKPAF